MQKVLTEHKIFLKKKPKTIHERTAFIVGSIKMVDKLLNFYKMNREELLSIYTSSSLIKDLTNNLKKIKNINGLSGSQLSFYCIKY